MNTDLVDAVYLWCDGQDPRFKKEKQETLSRLQIPLDKDNIGDLRFADNEELKFSLRSVWQNCPWINHIYIVTNNQIPSWLNESSRITIIDHREIIPNKLLPTFNSVVIEMFVHLIPGLQEKFLLLNDDIFIGSSVSPSFFFDNNLPVVRLKRANEHFPADVKSARNFLLDENRHSFEKTQVRALLLFWEKYKITPPLVLTHTVDSFTKTLMRETLERFPEILLRNRSPFRNGMEVQRLIFQLDMAFRKNARLKISPQLSFFQKHFPSFYNDSIECFEGTECDKVRNRIRSLKPTLFCLNSDIQMNRENREKSRSFLEECFPTPSPWEKENTF